MFTDKDDFDQVVEFIKQLPTFTKDFQYPNIAQYQIRHLRFVYLIHGLEKLKALKEFRFYPAQSEEYYFNIAYQAINHNMGQYLAGAIFLVSPPSIRRCVEILKKEPEKKALYHPEPFPPNIHFPVVLQCLPYIYYNKVGTDLTPTVHNELLYDVDTYNSLLNKTVTAVPKEILLADQYFSQYRSFPSQIRYKALQAAREQGNESLVVPFGLALSKGIALADLDASTIFEELNCCYSTNMNDKGSEQIEQNSTKLDSSNATVAPKSQSSNAVPSGNKLESSTQSKAATAIASKDTTAISNATPTVKDLAVASEHDKDDANNATKQAATASSSVATESNKGQQDNLSSSKNNSKGSIENSSASTNGSNHGSDLTSSDSSIDVGSDKAINNNRANGNDSGIKPSSTSHDSQVNNSANNEQSSTKTTVAASNSTTSSVSHDVSANEATADKGEGNVPSTVDNSSAKDNNSASTNDKQKGSNEGKAVSSTNVGNDSNTSNNSEAKPVAVIFQTFPGIDPVEKQAESSTNTANETIDASTNDDLAIEQELAAQEELEALYQSDYDDIDSDIDTDNEDSGFDEMLLEDIPTNVEFTNGKPCTPIKEATTNQEGDASNEDCGSCNSSDSSLSDATNKSDANSNEGYGETAENNSDSPEVENTEPEIDYSTLDPIARANMRASKLLAKGNMNDIDQSRKHGFDSNKLHVFGIGSQELNELLANTLQNKRKGITPNDLQTLPKRFVILGGAKNNVLRAKNLSNYHVLAIFGKQDQDYCNFCDQQDAKTKAQITKQNS